MIHFIDVYFFTTWYDLIRLIEYSTPTITPIILVVKFIEAYTLRLIRYAVIPSLSERPNSRPTPASSSVAPAGIRPGCRRPGWGSFRHGQVVPLSSRDGIPVHSAGLKPWCGSRARSFVPCRSPCASRH